MIKNNLLTIKNQLIVHLSPTEEGTVHDKKMSEEQELLFPDGVYLFQDSGYQGYEPANVHIIQPFKKPRNDELPKLKKMV
jgi:hypothetical protein